MCHQMKGAPRAPFSNHLQIITHVNDEGDGNRRLFDPLTTAQRVLESRYVVVHELQDMIADALFGVGNA